VHYLVTGHTGFKGAWLTALLVARGHDVSGISLNPEPQSIFENSKLSDLLLHDFRLDIRNSQELENAFEVIDPDVVIHLAAQSQVIKSYEFPVETFETNVNGTLNVLKGISKIRSLKAALIVTTDKVYKNLGTLHRYMESDPLGGSDPYSSSKAMADILTQSWQNSFQTVPIGIARAGNVIGGGDHSPNRLIPNLMEKLIRGENPIIRNPASVRPWQHVLDCLNGYLFLAEHLIVGKENSVWNFGPSEEVCRTVEDVTNLVISLVAPEMNWIQSSEYSPPEEKMLLIDSSKARNELFWMEKYDFETSVRKSVDWYSRSSEKNLTEFIFDEVRDFLQI
jgi:CDP-glucose 4,6-dehydratase